MNGHEHYEELISLCVDGEISELEKSKLFEHMENCEKCREFYSFCVGLDEKVKVEPPAELEGIIKERVLRERKRKYSKRWVSLAGLAAAMVAVVFIWQGSQLAPSTMSLSKSSQNDAAPAEMPMMAENMPMESCDSGELKSDAMKKTFAATTENNSESEEDNDGFKAMLAKNDSSEQNEDKSEPLSEPAPVLGGMGVELTGVILASGDEIRFSPDEESDKLLREILDIESTPENGYLAQLDTAVEMGGSADILVLSEFSFEDGEPVLYLSCK